MPRILLALALCVACRKSPPAPARFCDQDLTGLWLNASDTRLAYRFRDHGEVIRGEFLERQPDGGLQAPDDPILFELHRTDAGLGGVMRTQGPSPSGRICPVEYGTSVSECKPDALQVVVEMSAQIDDECKRTRLPDGGERPPDLSEFRFDRAPDGGR